MKVLCFAEHDLILKLRGKDLPVKDSWIQGGKADPYLLFFKNSCNIDSLVVPKSGEYMGQVDDKLYRCVYNGKKQYQQNTLDPVWPEITLNVHDLCDGGNIHKPFLINVWDYDFECPNDDFMGFCVLSIFDLIKAYLRKEGIPLQPGTAGHKWGGSLFVDKIKLCPWISTKNNSILHLIAEKADMDALKLLLDWNADVNALNGVTLSPPPAYSPTLLGLCLRAESYTRVGEGAGAAVIKPRACHGESHTRIKPRECKKRGRREVSGEVKDGERAGRRGREVFWERDWERGRLR
jgi:hypothetical protein